jgi:CheY-like chemotaxis protein
MGGLETIEQQVRKLPPGPGAERIERSVAMALQGTERAATLTARLLAFSRRQTLDPKPVDANRLVTGLADMFERTLGATIALETVSGAGLWRTLVDPSQLENALLNLAVNARDAMPGGGRLTIETSNAYLDDAYVEAIPEPILPGQYVLIAVSDTGMGMDDETLARVFEPFFTTKGVGKGTGLGLSQVYGFVRQSGGHVRIYSEPGDGTTVKIYLPRLADERAAEDTRLARPARRRGGQETILVVEDHEDLRDHTSGLLRELGYRVIEAPHGPAALRLLDAETEVDLLLVDVVLPQGMNGRQVASEAIRRRAGLKVLFTTGYAHNAIVHNGRLDPDVDLLGKPFTSSALAAKVRQVLDR